MRCDALSLAELLDFATVDLAEAVALDLRQIRAPLMSCVYLPGGGRDNDVEEALVSGRFRPGDATYPLRFLPLTLFLPVDFDEHICVRQVERCVSDTC